VDNYFNPGAVSSIVQTRDTNATKAAAYDDIVRGNRERQIHADGQNQGGLAASKSMFGQFADWYTDLVNRTNPRSVEDEGLANSKNIDIMNYNLHQGEYK